MRGTAFSVATEGCRRQGQERERSRNSESQRRVPQNPRALPGPPQADWGSSQARTSCLCRGSAIFAGSG